MAEQDGVHKHSGNHHPTDPRALSHTPPKVKPVQSFFFGRQSRNRFQSMIGYWLLRGLLLQHAFDTERFTWNWRICPKRPRRNKSSRLLSLRAQYRLQNLGLRKNALFCKTNPIRQTTPLRKLADQAAAACTPS
jgi:hypothetical protein